MYLNVLRRSRRLLLLNIFRYTFSKTAVSPSMPTLPALYLLLCLLCLTVVFISKVFTRLRQWRNGKPKIKRYFLVVRPIRVF